MERITISLTHDGELTERQVEAIAEAALRAAELGMTPCTLEEAYTEQVEVIA